MSDQPRMVMFQNVACPGCKTIHPDMLTGRDLLVEAVNEKKPSRCNALVRCGLDDHGA
jgi:hypothetical protein